MKKGILIILFFAICLQFVNADVISLNNGGSDEIVIGSNQYLEGFFSGDVLSSCGNGILEIPYEECDDGNYVSGDGCSSTCTTEATCGDGTCNGVETCSTCSADCGNCGGGGGGGGGPTGLNILVDPIKIEGHILVNANLEENIGITNLDKSKSAKVSISASGFYSDLIVSFWDDTNKSWVSSLSLTIPSGGIANLKIRFSAQSFVGNYSGTIIIGNKIVPVNLIVQEKLLLFDSNIVVLNEDYLVPQGDKLRTSVTLIPLGDEERMDVTLNYVIKDYNGQVYLTRSETVLVYEQVNFRRSFDTGFLPLGQYIIGLELIYPNGVAPSSAHFEIATGRQNTFFGKVVFFIVNLILIVLILLILFIVLRMIRQLIKNKKTPEELKEKDKEKTKEKEKIKEKENMKGKENIKEKEKIKEKENSKEKESSKIKEKPEK